MAISIDEAMSNATKDHITWLISNLIQVNAALMVANSRIQDLESRVIELSSPKQDEEETHA